MSNPLEFAHENQDRYLKELMDFLRIPSVSTQPEHKNDVASAAAWLATKMTAAGLENVHVIPTANHPLVYADWLHAGFDKPTVLIYGHYDVQPVEPFELWETPPFEPTLKDDYVYARGSADDKGQAYIHVKAVEAYLSTDGRLPVNVKFIVEGEEECGGASLTAFIAANAEMLAADVALISDSHMLTPQLPALVYGLRGMSYLYVDITGAAHDLHSGGYGGGVNNPINVISHIIAKLKDEDGRILIPGFYDDVRPLAAEERALLAQLPIDDATILQETGAPALWGEPEYTIVERLGARPTLDVNGIIGGYTGPGAKTVLPASVHAKISMRLVPNQDPDTITHLFTRYVQSITPSSVSVTITPEHSAYPWLADYNHPAIKAVKLAYGKVFEQEPVFLRGGGSIPVVSDFQTHLGITSALMGFGLPDDRLHAPNERFYLPNFYRGIETSIHFMRLYAG